MGEIVAVVGDHLAVGDDENLDEALLRDGATPAPDDALRLFVCKKRNKTSEYRQINTMTRSACVAYSLLSFFHIVYKVERYGRKATTADGTAAADEKGQRGKTNCSCLLADQPQQ